MNLSFSAPRPRRTPRRGSVLIVALLFSAIIAISLGSFLRLATHSTQLSYRTYYQGVSMNIAETGLEQAMWEANNAATPWVGWQSPSATSRRRTFPDTGAFELTGGAKAVVKVYAQERSALSPAWIAARAIITPPRGQPIERWIKVTLDRSSALNIALLGKRMVTANGNRVEMGSWDSDPDNDPSTPPVEFSDALLNDQVSIATTYFDSTINGGNSGINGSAAVGASTTDAIKVGPNGFIGPLGTEDGVIDPNSVSANFSADLPDAKAPAASYTALGAINAALRLPRPGDTPAADGIYYYSSSGISLNGSALSISPGYEVVLNIPKTAGDTISLGGNGGAIRVESTLVTNAQTGAQTYTPSKLSIYTDGDISMSGQAAASNIITTQTYIASSSTTTITISDVKPLYGKGQEKNTVIGWTYKRTASTTTTTDGVSSTTSSTNTFKVLIETGATEPVAGTTTIHDAAGTLRDTGTKIGPPIALKIYGTRTEAERATLGAQKIAISGNGSLSAVVYAPHGDISAKGGGNSGFIYGSLIGESIKFTGNDCFYYDESLARTDDDSRLSIKDWDEMVSYVDRNAYMTYLDF